jgi:Cu/Ag efflux pump CusA
MSQKIKQFAFTSWCIENRTAVYIFTIIISLMGYSIFNSLPKEQFPDIVVPTIFISTIHPGTTPSDVENLLTKPIEKQVKAISGVKKVTSNSIQDFSAVIVEFNTDVDPDVAKQKVSDAVDKAKSDLPSDLKTDPVVQEIAFSEFPIMQINVAGNYDLFKLKDYADDKQVVVKTQILQPGGQPIAVDYTLEGINDAWKVYDISIEGVSLVTNYRNQFGNEIRQNGIDGLIQKLVDKNKDNLSKKTVN